MDFLIDNGLVILILAVAGCVAGLLAGLFGIGGGVVVVPVIFFLLQGLDVDASLAMPMAVSTSLATIIPTALSSIRAHHRLANIDWALIKRLSLPMVIGILLGSQMIAHLRTPAFAVFFGLFLLFLAANGLWSSNRKAYLPQLPTMWIQAPTALAVGVTAAIAGVGGGAIGVPLLAAANVPVHRAIGSCAVFGLLVAVVGVTSIILTSATPSAAPPGTWSLVYWPGFFALVPLTVLMAPYGAKLGKRLNTILLRRLFAGILLIAGARILYSAWGG